MPVRWVQRVQSRKETGAAVEACEEPGEKRKDLGPGVEDDLESDEATLDGAESHQIEDAGVVVAAEEGLAEMNGDDAGKEGQCQYRKVMR